MITKEEAKEARKDFLNLTKRRIDAMILIIRMKEKVMLADKINSEVSEFIKQHIPARFLSGIDIDTKRSLGENIQLLNEIKNKITNEDLK